MPSKKIYISVVASGTRRDFMVRERDECWSWGGRADTRHNVKELVNIGMGRYGLNHENEIIYKSIDNIMILAKYIFLNLQPFSEAEPVSFCFISICHQFGCNHVVYRNICVCVFSPDGEGLIQFSKEVFRQRKF